MAGPPVVPRAAFRVRSILCGCLILAGGAASDARSDCKLDPRECGIFCTTLSGAEEDSVSITWTFNVAQPGKGRVFVPLPDGPVLDDCVYQWRPSTPAISVVDEVGRPVAFRVVAQSRLVTGPNRATPDTLRDGAIYILDFSTPLGGIQNARQIQVTATFRDTINANAGKVDFEGPTRGGRIDFPIDRSFVNWTADTIGDFQSQLARQGRSYAGSSECSDAANTLKALVQWTMRATYKDGENAPRVASQVLAYEAASCYGFANLTQAVLARMNVESRAVCGVVPPFGKFGKAMSGNGSSLHVVVEYRNNCKWGVMDPQFSDNMSLPFIRLTCGRESNCLAAWSENDITYASTAYTVVPARTPVLIAPERRTRFLLSDGDDRKPPLFDENKYYRQFEAATSCADQCREPWRPGRGSSK